MNKRNYHREMEQEIEKNRRADTVPTLLLHSCCAPCSSHVLEYLSRFFSITVYYYNPNIYPPKEYDERAQEQKRFMEQFPAVNPVALEVGKYEPELFYSAVKGLEKEPEGKARCMECYRLRLEVTAKKAKDEGYDYYTTSLTISPLKQADQLNKIGEELAGKYGIAFLNSDFKKKDGYKRSVALSEQYGLYRQDYCGCVFSMNRSNCEIPDEL